MRALLALGPVAFLAACPAPAPLPDAGAVEADAGRDAGWDAGPGDAPDPGCTRPGCLRAVEAIGDFTQAQLAAVVLPGAVVENGYSVYTLDLWTDGVPARATVAIPHLASAPAGGWDLVANAHGTTGVADTCAVAGTLAGAGLAGLYGARGLIGVAPDYPGLGTAGLHPYLVAKSEGRAVLDAVRAARQLARWKGVPTSGRTAIVGLSQGGHAALSAGREHAGWAPELDVRALAASGPASMFEEHWRSGINVDGPHVALHAMLIYAWAQHYGWSGPALWTTARQADIDQTMSTRCAYPAEPDPSLAAVLGNQASAIFSSGFLTAYRTGAWGVYQPFSGWFSENRVRPWALTAPLRIYQGTADDTVLEWATRQLVDALRDGGMTLDYVVVPDAGHADLAFGYLAYPQARTEESLAWLKQMLQR